MPIERIGKPQSTGGGIVKLGRASDVLRQGVPADDPGNAFRESVPVGGVYVYGDDKRRVRTADSMDWRTDPEFDQFTGEVRTPVVEAYKGLRELTPAESWWSDTSEEQAKIFGIIPIGDKREIVEKSRLKDTPEMRQWELGGEFQSSAARAQIEQADEIRSPIPEGVNESGRSVGATIVRWGGHEGAADAANRVNAIIAKGNETRDDSTVGSVLRGAARNLTTTLIAGGNPKAVIALNAANAYNQAKTEAKDEGKSPSEQRNFALRQAGIEGITTAIFQKAGLGGAESGMAKNVIKQAVQQGWRQLGWSAVKQFTAEELEELSIDVMGNLERKYVSGINYQPYRNEQGGVRITEKVHAEHPEWGKVGDFMPGIKSLGRTFVETAGTMGLLNTIPAVLKAKRAWVERNQSLAQQVAALPDNPSRGQIEKLGIKDAGVVGAPGRSQLVRGVRAVLDPNGIVEGDTVDVLTPDGAWRSNAQPVKVVAISKDGKSARLEGSPRPVLLKNLRRRDMPKSQPVADPNATTGAYAPDALTPVAGPYDETQVLPQLSSRDGGETAAPPAPEVRINNQTLDEQIADAQKTTVPPAEPPAVETPTPAAVAPGRPTTGTKNAKTDELRAAAGMEERPPVEAQKREQWDAEAAQRIAADPQYAPNLASGLAANPRAIDPIEEMALNRHIRDLENRRQAGEDVFNELATAVEAAERVGTVWGRAGVARQAERAADFSLEKVIRDHIRAVNEKPSAEQMAKYAELVDRANQLEAELNAAQASLAQAEIDRQIAEAKAAKIAPEKPTPEKGKREKLKRAASEAVDAFKKEWAKLSQLGAINDPRANAEKWAQITRAAGKVVKAYVDLGVDSFMELVARARKDVGEFGADQLEALKDAWKSLRAESPAAKPDPEEIGVMARKLTRWAVEMGIEDREAVVDAVHKELNDLGFEVDRSQTMAAMSGYGDFRELSKDEISVKVRAINGELQQLLKLEDMQGGKAPKKTGTERREPTDEERRLIKLVNEAKKRGGYEVTDPETQLKSALESLKTGVRNRIADMEREIAAREKTVKERTPITPDAELTDLRAKRDKLQAEYRRVFPPTKKERVLTAKQQEEAAQREIEKLQKQLKDVRDGKDASPTKRPSLLSAELAQQLKAWRERLKAAKQAVKDAELASWEGEGGTPASPKAKAAITDEQKLRMMARSLEWQIESLQADLKAGHLGPKQRGVPLTSPEVEAKRQQLNALKQLREQARAASPEYQAQEAAKKNAAYRKSLERQMAFWKQRRDEAARGKLPEKRKPPPVDNEILEKKYQIELVKRQAQAEVEEAERAARGPVGKALGFGGDLLDLARSVMTGFELSAVLRQGAFYTLGFPQKAIPALIRSVGAALSRRADFAIHDDLMKRANHIDYVRGGLETTAGDGPLSQREEMIRSRIATAIANKEGAAWALPRWAAEGILGGERAFRSFLNTMRADLFDYMKDGIEASRPGTWSEADAKIVANAANVFSGRAQMKAALGLSRVFFAPRWLWSRAQLMVGAPAWKGDRASRIAVGKVYVRAALGMASYMAIRHALYSALADDEKHKPKYEPDMRSSDFGKMRVGETRVDSGTGINQLVTLLARTATGEVKRSSGRIVPIRGKKVPYGGDTTWDVWARFMRTKLAPLPSAVADYAVGQNLGGEEVTASDVVTDRVMPMTWRDIFEAEQELNVPQGTVAAMEAFFGAGVSTYGPRSKRRAALSER